LKREKPELRIPIVMTLAKLGGQRATEILIDQLEDKAVRIMAAGGLVYLDHPRGLEVLQAALEDQDPEVRMSAIETLGELRVQRAVEPIITALNDEDPRVRRMAFEALAHLGDKRAVEPIVKALITGDHYTVRDAARALHVLGWQPSDDDVKARYLVGLGELGDAVALGFPAVEPLILALKCGDARIQCIAAKTLGSMGSTAQAAVPALTELLKDKEPLVRVAASAALEKIRAKEGDN
jgi:HEAT repeat protein